jgi:hypothetical protein
MNMKSASVLLVLLLSWALLGGCPASMDGTGADTSADSVPADSADNSNGDATPADLDGGSEPSDGDDASDDGTSSDGPTSDDTGNGSGDVADDDGTDVDDNGEPAFTGAYSGQWTRVGQESLGGTPGREQEWTTDQTMTFGADGIPTAYIVPGYRQTEGGIDFVAEVKQLGDSVTLQESADGMDYTLTVTVALATYGETTARVVLNLIHHGEGSNEALTQDGTGVQVVEYSLQGGQLEYSSMTTYEVAWFYDSIDTTWEVSCEGTLSPE